MKIKDAVSELLETGEVTIDGEIFIIHEIKKSKSEADNKFYFESMLSKKNKKTVYGHVKPANTKKESILLCFEHLAMMGYDLQE